MDDEALLRGEIKQRRPFRSLAEEATIALLRTADHIRTEVAGVMEAAGVTMQQYNVLRILRGAHPAPLATLEIGERMIERQPGITRLLDRIESKGLVRRERCPTDRRIVHAYITSTGLELLADLDEPVIQADESLLAALSEPEIRSLLSLLERIRAGCA